MSFKNKVVLVVGASSGIGATTAISFAKEAANVVILARNEEKLQNVYEQCTELGAASLKLIADITKDDDVRAAVNKTIEHFGKLDILINNAGIIRIDSILSGTVMDTYDDVMNTNLRAIVNITSLSAPHLVKTKGNIVNISSVAGSMAKCLSMHMYAVSKAALNQFTKVAALELASVGVRVNAVIPGPVYTEIAENAGISFGQILEAAVRKPALGRISDTQEIADLILFLASNKAKGITGSEFVCDNGVHLQ